MEEALRTKNRRVTIPYWDSTLDFRMKDPRESILWTEMFLGNGIGIVNSGPFALWRTPSNNTYLRRQLAGTESSLVDPDKLWNVFTKKYHREILPPTATKLEDNLEEHHNGVHRWVGGLDGHMGGLDTSAMDPVFFLHHCYIDYLWEKFRTRQKRLRINSETDYPAGTQANQQPYRIMDNLYPPKKSIEGYSNSFTKYIYRYADAPTCRNGCGRGYNGFLFCNRKTNKCESRSRRGFYNMGGFGNKDVKFYRNKVSESRSSFMPALSLRINNVNSAPTMERQFAVGLVDSRTTNK